MKTLERYEHLAQRDPEDQYDMNYADLRTELAHALRALNAACESGRGAAQRAAAELGIHIGDSVKTTEELAEMFLQRTAEEADR